MPDLRILVHAQTILEIRNSAHRRLPLLHLLPGPCLPYVDLFVIMRNARLLAANSFARPWDPKKELAHSTVPSGSNDAHNFMMFLASKFPAAVP